MANPVNFATFGQDPISSNTIDGNWITIPVGAGPIVFFVNATNTGAGHLGDGNCTNINLISLCGMMDGTLQRNVDICEPAERRHHSHPGLRRPCLFAGAALGHLQHH